MALYPFVADDGTFIEEWHSMESPPKIGEERVVEGRVYRRVINLPSLAVAKSKHFKSWSLPTVQNMDPALREAVPAYDKKDGAPLFSSKKEVDEFSSHSQRLFEKGKVDEAFVYGEAPPGPDLTKKRVEKRRQESFERMFGPEPEIA